ncbi:MAG TPA: hypothetical protein VFE60_08995 [Roseiarcus sp.]|jgi:hypothetical protein|nr:hypothetical protein [Roseiarcus sp.]
MDRTRIETIVRASLRSLADGSDVELPSDFSMTQAEYDEKDGALKVQPVDPRLREESTAKPPPNPFGLGENSGSGQDNQVPPDRERAHSVAPHADGGLGTQGLGNSALAAPLGWNAPLL